jgi:hypothetical protein
MEAEVSSPCSQKPAIGRSPKPAQSSLCALTKHHAMKAYWRSGGIGSRILDLGTWWRWVISFHTYKHYLSNIHFNIIFLSTPSSSLMFSDKILYHF